MASAAVERAVARGWCLAMSHGTFKVTLSMKKEPHGSPVYCKMDGQRFKQAKTVKLHTDTTYRIDVSFKPPRSLEKITVLGQDMETCERWRDSTASAYSGYYTTQGIIPSRKGHREDMPIVMRVKETGELSTCLQIKFYRQADVQHCEWGSRLHCIELDCSAAEGSLSVTESGDSVNMDSIPFFIAPTSLVEEEAEDLLDQNDL
ncbi:CB1 cannabinoid receptor-interacting protein 1-like isoform X1 [Cloeon dipterum]